jgi:hypothetical protein
VDGQIVDVESCSSLVFSASKGRWYSVAGTGKGMRASICETTSGFDTQRSAFKGDCSDLECVGGGDHNCRDQAAVAWYSEAGAEYYILVGLHAHPPFDINRRQRR